MENIQWELATLYEIGRVLSASPELDDLIRTIVNSAITLGNAKASWFALHDRTSGNLSYAASQNLDQDIVSTLADRAEEWIPLATGKELEPIIFTDLKSNPVLKIAAERHLLDAAAIVKITYKEALVGVLTVFWDRSRQFLSECIEPIFLLANQAGAAIENAILLREARRRSIALDAMFNVIQTIGRSPRIKPVLDAIINQANRLLGTDRSIIRLVDPVTRELTVGTTLGISRSTMRNIKLKVGEGILGRVAKEGKPIIINDVASYPEARKHAAEIGRVASLLCVPMILENKTIGVLMTGSSKPKIFTEEDKSLLMLLASQAAVVTENARLYEQVNKQLSELRILYRMAEYLASTADVSTLLQFIVNHLAQSFGAKFGSLRLLDEEGATLLTGAIYGTTDEYTKVANENVQMTLDPATPSGQSPAAVAIREKRICAVADISRNRRFAAWRDFARMEGYKSLVCVPLIPADEPIGVLSLYFKKIRRFRPGEQKLLQTAARTSAIALQRAILDERLLREEVTRRALEEVSHLKTEFVSLVSHELRTPLTSIQGYVKLLLEGHTGKLNALQGEFLTTVSRNTEKLIALVNDLLDISRIESGRLELVMEPLDLSEVVQNEIETLKALADEKEIQIIVDFEEGLTKVKADSHRLGQIISNLLSNAIKYSPPRSKVKITANQLGKNVLVKVIDSGIGIAPEERAKLFQRFYRSSDQAVQSTHGTGLGLAITRYLVEMHGGKIWVESEKGQGSTFSFTISALPAESA
ncbi:MAG: GAF domain-containing protein [Armatimonadetes bacterium]|nr:GAF domain-containing protein [Armatimonadota bacterium]